MDVTDFRIACPVFASGCAAHPGPVPNNAMPDELSLTDLVVTRTDRVADGIVRFELRAADGGSFAAGPAADWA